MDERTFCLAIIKYIRDKVATAKSKKEALEIIDEIVNTLEEEHIAGIVARLGLYRDK